MFEQKKEGDEDDLEEEVYEPDLTLDDINDIECEGDTQLGCIQMIPPRNKSHENSLEKAKSENSISHVTYLAYDSPITRDKSPFGSSLGSL